MTNRITTEARATHRGDAQPHDTAPITGSRQQLTHRMRAAGIVPALLAAGDAETSSSANEVAPAPSSFAMRQALATYRGEYADSEFFEVTCPITRDLCRFPVQLGDGHTYELSAVLQLRPAPWQVGLRSPFSQQPLPFPPEYRCDPRVLDLVLYQHVATHGSFDDLPMWNASEVPEMPPSRRWTPTMVGALLGGTRAALVVTNVAYTYRFLRDFRAAIAEGLPPNPASVSCNLSACGPAAVEAETRDWTLTFDAHTLWSTNIDLSIVSEAARTACTAALDFCQEQAREATAPTDWQRNVHRLTLAALGVVGVASGAATILGLRRLYRSYLAHQAATMPVAPPSARHVNAQRLESRQRVERAFAEDLASLRRSE